jgi:mannosyltransferase OCH1-like enzyme
MPSNFNPIRKGKQQQRLPQYRYRKPTKNANESTVKRRAIIRMCIIGFLCMLLLHQLYLMVEAIIDAPNTTTPEKVISSNQDTSDTVAVRQDVPQEIITALQTKLEPMSQTQIPKIVHFVYGMKDRNPELDVLQYLSIKSAQEVIKPEKILFHYHYLPTGEWFELIRPHLTLRKVEIPTKIFGNRVDHYAHRADVVRLEALKEFGGIYLDLDVIMLKSVDHLLDEQFVMGHEGIGEFIHPSFCFF